MGFTKRLFYHISAIAVGLSLSALAKKCPTTEVPQYEFNCGVLGDIRSPSIYKIQKNTTSGQDCGQLCLEIPKCRSIRWISQTSKCYIYDQYLAHMNTDLSNYESGILWERECWTNNCNLINSCAATKPCANFTDYYGIWDDVSYIQYACSYGKTAQRSTPGGAKFGVFSTVLYDGTMSPCDVVYACGPGDYVAGTLDVHYHIPSNKWVCIRYDDLYDATSPPTTGEEHIYRSRYSLKNDTVGAGYGFMWLSAYHYCYPVCS